MHHVALYTLDTLHFRLKSLRWLLSQVVSSLRHWRPLPSPMLFPSSLEVLTHCWDSMGVTHKNRVVERGQMAEGLRITREVVAAKQQSVRHLIL
jgi:hypothetical protein